MPGDGARTTGGGPEDSILVGIVARPHGRRGEVIVNLHTDFPERRFREGATFDVSGREGTPRAVTVTAVRFHQGRPIVALDGIESIDAAERLAGAEFRVPGTDALDLPAGSYYHHDLVGCEVVDAHGEKVGQVVAVEGEMANSRLVVRGRAGDVLIPLAADLCRVDTGARRILVTPPEGLLDLNGDWR